MMLPPDTFVSKRVVLSMEEFAEMTCQMLEFATVVLSTNDLLIVLR